MPSQAPCGLHASFARKRLLAKAESVHDNGAPGLPVTQQTLCAHSNQKDFSGFYSDATSLSI